MYILHHFLFSKSSVANTLVSIIDIISHLARGSFFHLEASDRFNRWTSVQEIPPGTTIIVPSSICQIPPQLLESIVSTVGYHKEKKLSYWIDATMAPARWQNQEGPKVPDGSEIFASLSP